MMNERKKNKYLRDFLNFTHGITYYFTFYICETRWQNRQKTLSKESSVKHEIHNMETSSNVVKSSDPGTLVSLAYIST